MAKIIKNNHHLEKEYIEESSCRPKCIVAFFALLLVSAFCIAMYTMTNHNMILFCIGTLSLIVGSCVLAFGILKSDSKAKILKSGIEGEASTALTLAQLPADYTVVQDVYVTFDGGRSEIDSIVVGKTGVFVVETKNMNGYITGDIDDKDWVQHKVGRGGTPYNHTFYSPVKQVNTHIYRLAHYLRKNGVRTYINGIVYFSNPEGAFTITGEKEGTVLFGHSQHRNMLKYITSGEDILTKKQVKQIVKLIEKSK